MILAANLLYLGFHKGVSLSEETYLADLSQCQQAACSRCRWSSGVTGQGLIHTPFFRFPDGRFVSIGTCPRCFYSVEVNRGVVA